MDVLSIDFIASVEWWFYLILSIISSSISNFADSNSNKLHRLIGYVGLSALIGLLILTTSVWGWFGGLALLLALIVVVLLKQKIIWKIFRDDIPAKNRPVFDQLMEGVPLRKHSISKASMKELYEKIRVFMDWP